MRSPCWLSQKSVASAVEMQQNKGLGDAIASAKSDFLTEYAEVAAFATLRSEQIDEQLSMVTAFSHLRP
eukprot:812873-Pyramimonas_sp.AAC.1